MSWKVAILRAAIVEAILAAIVLITGSGAIPGFNGADNPLWSFVAVILQFPACALALVTLPLGEKLFSPIASAYFTAIIIVTVEFLLLAVVFRYSSRSCKLKPGSPTSA